MNLNIRYDFPIWKYRVPIIYSKTEGWIKGTNYWFSENETEKHICSSIEPAGLAFSGLMEDEEWKEWSKKIKEIATKILGYKIGEIETGEVGHDFIWVDSELKVFEDFRSIFHSKDKSKAWDFFELNTSKLTELEKIELDKKMFKLKWHDLHDNLATNFQINRHPETSKFLYESVISNEIPELDYKPISRKCIWALADIGTDESKKYLHEISKLDDKLLIEFANKRITNWDKEKPRKTRQIVSSIKFEKRIKLEPYLSFSKRLPNEGRHITGFQTDEEIIVYQAYNLSIAKYAVENQKLGGSKFNYNRMSWIKPNFLWMMYRCGWAEKLNQERVLAIWIRKEDWEEILSNAVFSSYQEEIYKTKEDWRFALSESEVRLQWDPAHHPNGEKLKRKAIQIGMKGDNLRKFGQEKIQFIQDVTYFVKKQKLYLNNNQLEYLEIPKETIYKPQRTDLRIGIKTG